MAEQAETHKEEQPAQPAKRGSSKTIIMVLAVFVIEALVICGAFLFAGRPAEVKGEGIDREREAEVERPVELLVIADRFQNTQSGRPYIYDTEIYVVVRAKHQELVETRLADMSAQIATELNILIRRAESSLLNEPSLGALTRQIKAMLDARIGNDPDGKALIENVLIKKCMGFRADF